MDNAPVFLAIHNSLSKMFTTLTTSLCYSQQTNDLAEMINQLLLDEDRQYSNILESNRNFVVRRYRTLTIYTITQLLPNLASANHSSFWLNRYGTVLQYDCLNFNLLLIQIDPVVRQNWQITHSKQFNLVRETRGTEHTYSFRRRLWRRSMFHWMIIISSSISRKSKASQSGRGTPTRPTCSSMMIFIIPLSAISRMDIIDKWSNCPFTTISRPHHIQEASWKASFQTRLTVFMNTNLHKVQMWTTTPQQSITTKNAGIQLNGASSPQGLR